MRLVFDFPDASGASCRRVLERPVEQIVAHTLDEVRPALDVVNDAAANGLHAAGWVSYEASPAFEPAMRVRPGHRLPLVRFALFEDCRRTAAPTRTSRTTPALDWSPDTSRHDFESAVARIRNAIGRGETYQVNLTFRLHSLAPSDPTGWYETLRTMQGGGYTADLDFGDTRILSASPELFFRREGSALTVKPMKGTRRRGRWSDEDRRLGADLAGSAKDRAENLMIVDLMRNDLGRVARTGTVRVPAMFQIERYRTVWQMTSTVTAEARPDVSLTDIFAALFPCGSVTGAPKIATTRFIADLETSPREVYCGAIGLIEPGGDCTFNVPIRTAWIDTAAGIAEYGVGAGITWDSTPGDEYDESLAKAALLGESWPDFELLETLRAAGGSIERLDRHLARIRDSAACFDYAFDERHARAALLGAVADGQEPLRLRLRVAVDGTVAVDRSVDVAPVEPVPVTFAHEPVSSGDRFLHHKTTARHTYESRLARHPDMFDVILTNEDGLVTEFTRGNIVVEAAGRRLTPGQAAGLLAGTFRAELLDRGEIAEADLRPDDVRGADRIWLINSVRGWLRARLIEPA